MYLKVVEMFQSVSPRATLLAWLKNTKHVCFARETWGFALFLCFDLTFLIETDAINELYFNI